jgi:hypothetical protein
MARPPDPDPQEGQKKEPKATLRQRMMRVPEQSPELQLKQAQDVLSWAIRKRGADSPFTVKAMNEVANQLARQARTTEEAVLRWQIIDALRTNLGPEDEATLNAEWKLATCLTSLDRPEDADPLLTHVVAGKALALGNDDPETLAARAWSATVAKKLGRLPEARLQQEQVVAGYELQGLAESDQGILAALNLASTLTALHDFDGASRLLRHVLDLRSRTLGSDDPRTLDVLEALASVSFMNKNVPEATVMARNLVEKRARVLGDDAEETIKSRAFLASIEAHGDSA